MLIQPEFLHETFRSAGITLPSLNIAIEHPGGVRVFSFPVDTKDGLTIWRSLRAATDKTGWYPIIVHDARTCPAWKASAQKPPWKRRQSLTARDGSRIASNNWALRMMRFPAMPLRTIPSSCPSTSWPASPCPRPGSTWFPPAAAMKSPPIPLRQLERLSGGCHSHRRPQVLV